MLSYVTITPITTMIPVAAIHSDALENSYSRIGIYNHRLGVLIGLS